MAQKQRLNIIDNPYAKDIRKDLKLQILHQIEIVRLKFSDENVNPFSLYNSIKALEDIIIPYLEKDDLFIKLELDKDREAKGKEKKSIARVKLRDYKENEKKNANLLNKINRNPNLLYSFKYRYAFSNYLHSKFKILIKVCIKGGIITIVRELIDEA